ncbi:hypothetical protein [Paenibacillus cremeus]|uniref:GNAT family N-acetyltransferase n=1 Tax=Paenibacillus cremeus TaxID=2163881 RepID=A0A559K6A3_9BACL|nr:hypothetical protein [Paenibacillus cremeus]TVY07671.1 hypothetical protein FPZ49_22580 [Paenibacillus cremeus]
MKIALHKELPAETQVQQLIDSITEPAEAGMSAHEICTSNASVIAAYDEERLVALGRLVDGCTGPQAFKFAVLPDYKERQIERYMRKLLML